MLKLNVMPNVRFKIPRLRISGEVNPKICPYDSHASQGIPTVSEATREPTKNPAHINIRYLTDFFILKSFRYKT